MKTVMLYLNNGDTYLGNHYTEREAVNKIKLAGYNQFYKGRNYYDRQLCFVAIDKLNTVGIEQRRENGLRGARKHFIK